MSERTLPETALPETALPEAVLPGDRGIAVVGTAGASPAMLTARLNDLAGSAGSGEPVRVLALDLSTAAGTEEADLLARLLAAGGPVALVGVGAGRVIGWPQRLAAVRDRLDPRHRLAVFAVALDAEPESGGLAELARWCAAPEWVSRPSAPEDGALPAGSAPPTPPRQPASGDGAMTRADRLTGARAGLTELRVQLSGQIRVGAQELNQHVSTACDRLRRRDVPVFDRWLEAALNRYREVVLASLAAGTEQVRAAALVGTGGSRVALPAPPVSSVVPLTGEVRSRLSADELVLLALGGSAGLGAGRVTAAPLLAWAGLGGLGTALTVLIGLAVAAGVVAVRRQGAARAATRRAASESIAVARGIVEQAVAAGLSAAEAQISRDLPVRPRVGEPNGVLVRPTL